MPTLRTRASKGSALTHAELDANFKRTVTQKTDDYQILISDNRSVIEVNKATATTITLPPVATADDSETGDFETTITNIGAGTSTVDGSGAEAVDGGTGITLYPWESVTVQLNSAQTAWKTVDRNQAFPPGTAMLFYQTAAPTGWTRDTTAAMDDHALRVVTDGTWGSGTNGTTDFTTQFAQAFASEAGGAHTHDTVIPATGWSTTTAANARAFWANSAVNRVANRTLTTDDPGTHTHDVNLGVKYLDVIIATKD